MGWSGEPANTPDGKCGGEYLPLFRQPPAAADRWVAAPCEKAEKVPEPMFEARKYLEKLVPGTPVESAVGVRRCKPPRCPSRQPAGHIQW